MSMAMGDWEGSRASGKLEGQLPRMSSAVKTQPCWTGPKLPSIACNCGRELMELAGEDSSSSLSLSTLQGAHECTSVKPYMPAFRENGTLSRG